MQDNIVIKSSGNTIKLESTPEEVTGGYFDSEEVWHEFGGGGSEINTPIITITVVDNTSGKPKMFPIYNITEEGVFEISFGSRLNSPCTSLMKYQYANEGAGGFIFDANLSSADGAVYSNAVNCFFDETNMSVNFTGEDVSQGCSITITINDLG